MAATIRSPKVFYGWWIVLAYLLLNVYWSGTLGVGLTVFFAPIRTSFGWSAALLAAIFSLENLASSLLAPAVGLIFDQRGPRGLMLAASLLAGAGLIVLSRTASLPTFAGAFVLLSIGFAIWGAGTGPAIAAIWFVERRGLAMGLIVAGSSLGGILVPLWSAVVGAAGWRTALLIAGCTLLLLGMPLSLLLRHRPEKYGLAPDGGRPPTPVAAIGTPPQPALRLSVALRTPDFWIVTATATAAASASAALNVHVLPSLREARVAEVIAVAAVTAIALLGIPARLGSGWLADRMQVVPILAATYVLQGAGLLLLAAVFDSAWVLWPAVAAVGVGGANVFLVPSLVLVRRVGTAAFGRIQGVLLLCTGLGRVAGPIVAGAIRDWHGYALAYLLFGVISLLAALPLLGLSATTLPAVGRTQ